jgi:twitching motility protein PilT
MDHITGLIENMLANASDGLLLMVGKQPVMRVQGKVQTVASTPMTEADLVGFLTGPLGQPAATAASASSESIPFQVPAGGVLVKKVQSSGVLTLQITPAPAPAPVKAVESVAAVPAASSGRMEGYFHRMISERASDLHLSSGMPPILRKDGGMVPLEEAPLTPEALHSLLMEIIPERNRVEFAETMDTDFAHEIPGQARFRCNYFQDRNGCGAVFRQIPVDILTADQLGLPQQLLKLCQLTKGLVLVTGPTGSGKSTTLAALVDHINKTRRDHIITIEDPIEFVHQNQKCLVNQREVNVHTKGFKPALRAALREDPDIVLVGEMRDLETISIAIETAETGHLVFGTLHTTTAVSTIDRIIDQFPADRQGQVRVMLSESLRGVISQTLCKKKGGGRVAALEVLLYTRAIGNLIREGKTFQIPSAMQTGKKEGMMQLNDALLTLVNQGQITADEAFKRAVDKDGIEPLLADKGLTVGV